MGIRKKYKLINSENLSKGSYRLQALRNFADVKEGDLGGYVDSEHNVSHYGNCWVYASGSVLQDSRIFGNTCVKDRARVTCGARVWDSVLSDDSLVSFQSIVRNCTVSGTSRIDTSEVRRSSLRGSSSVTDSKVHDCSLLGDAHLSSGAYVTHSTLYGNCDVSGEVRIMYSTLEGSIGVEGQAYLNKCRLYGPCYIAGTTHMVSVNLYGGITISGDSRLGTAGRAFNIAADEVALRDAFIKTHRDFCMFAGFGSHGRTTAAYRTANGIQVSCGCFLGTTDEFRRRVQQTHHAHPKIEKLYLGIANVIDEKLSVL